MSCWWSDLVGDFEAIAVAFWLPWTNQVIIYTSYLVILQVGTPKPGEYSMGRKEMNCCSSFDRLFIGSTFRTAGDPVNDHCHTRQ
jgi:hypothetical protein